MVAWLVGAGVCAAVWAGTQSALWGLGAGLAAFFLVRWLRPGPLRGPAPGPPPTRPPRTERATSIEVVCKTVTPARQEWVSVKTGRLYDVLSENGVAGARPGDRGRVTLTGAGWRIDPPADAQKTQPPDTGATREGSA